VSDNVFQAALLSLVVILAAGPNAALYCGLWCHSAESMTSGCEHHHPTGALKAPVVVPSGDCAIGGSAVVFVREAAQRNTSAPKDQSAVAVPRFAFNASSAGASSTYDSGSQLPLELRPLVLALRI